MWRVYIELQADCGVCLSIPLRKMFGQLAQVLLKLLIIVLQQSNLV